MRKDKYLGKSLVRKSKHSNMMLNQTRKTKTRTKTKTRNQRNLALIKKARKVAKESQLLKSTND